MDFLSKIGEAFDQGGFMMWPILGLSIFSLGITVERVIVLYFQSSVDKEKFIKQLQAHIFEGRLDRVIRFCAGQKFPLARIIHAGLTKVHKGDDAVQAAMDEMALQIMPRIEKRTGYLALLGNVATLAGLLGTITGLIRSFAAVAEAEAATKAAELAKGISEAMNCTAFGLLVAIPALLCFAVLNGKTQTIVDDVNDATVRILNFIVENRDKLTSKGGKDDDEE